MTDRAIDTKAVMIRSAAWEGRDGAPRINAHSHWFAHSQRNSGRGGVERLLDEPAR